MNVFAPLLDELDQWQDQGSTASLWWRDDDAMTVTPALEALLRVSDRTCTPVVLATIPFGATATLAERLARSPQVRVWQHGIRHANIAAATAKKQELTAAAPQTICDLALGQSKLRAMFGTQFQPALVPPWNRIAPELLPHLENLGFQALSTYKSRRRAWATANVWQVNTHVDLMAWRPERRFLGSEACISDICRHLATKRAGEADMCEPTGVLTHHLVMPDKAWDFLAALFDATKKHPSCEWVAPAITLPALDDR
jgi:hypothetical protein